MLNPKINTKKFKNTLEIQKKLSKLRNFKISIFNEQNPKKFKNRLRFLNRVKKGRKKVPINPFKLKSKRKRKRNIRKKAYKKLRPFRKPRYP